MSDFARNVLHYSTFYSARTFTERKVATDIETEVMKGPVECVSPDQAMDKSSDFSEYMWMAEENIDDFDKQCEAELWEEMMMNQALDEFEAQTEAQLYAQEHLTPPRHRGGPNSGPPQQQYDQTHLAQRMNGLQVNSYGYPAPPRYAAPPPNRPSQAPNAAPNAANVAATSTLNPNAPAFVLNPDAPAFVPSWEAPASNNEPSKEEDESHR